MVQAPVIHRRPRAALLGREDLRRKGKRPIEQRLPLGLFCLLRQHLPSDDVRQAADVDFGERCLIVRARRVVASSLPEPDGS